MCSWGRKDECILGENFSWLWCAAESVSSYWAVVLGVVCMLNRSKRRWLTHANRSKPFPVCQSPQPLPLSWRCLHKLACICIRIHLFCSLSTNGIFSFFIYLYLSFLIQSLCCVFHPWVSQQMAFSALKPSGNVSKSFRESLEMNSDAVKNHDGSSLHWFMIKLYLQILTVWFGFMCILNLARNTVLVFPSSSGCMRMMKYTVRTNAEKMKLNLLQHLYCKSW